MGVFYLKVLAPERHFYEGDCEQLVIPTTDGEYGILADHSNMIAAVIPGEIRITIPGEKTIMAAVSNGIIKVENNNVTVLTESLEKPEEIDEMRAKRSLEEAQDAILQKKSKHDYLQAQAKMNRALNRLKVKNHKGF